jgi:hypothetical protein
MPVRRKPNQKPAVEHNEGGQFRRNVTPQMLAQLRRDRGESMEEFGLSLKRAIEPDARDGFSRGLINNIEKGKQPISKTVQGAFWAIAAAVDDIDAEIASKVVARVLARPGQIPDGALIPDTAKAVRCANPACGKWFVRTHPFQRYHSPTCKPMKRRR